MALLLILLILAASWSPDSRMTALLWVPGWLAALADRDPNFRTALPFIPLAFLLAWGFAWRGWKWPVMGSMLVSGACLGAAELGQLFLPARTADVADLMWGAAGIAVGLVLACVARWQRRILNRE
jgi:VanZ family protein